MIAGQNIIKFNVGEIIKSIYSNKIYQIKKENNGMAKLLNIETGRLEDWNSCNNSHFILSEKQLRLL